MFPIKSLSFQNVPIEFFTFMHKLNNLNIMLILGSDSL